MSTTICITAQDDGMFSVELQDPEMESYEEGSELDMSEDAAEGEAVQSYESIDEALDAVRAMLENQAMEYSPEAGGQAMMDGEEEFTAGFKNVRGNGL